MLMSWQKVTYGAALKIICWNKDVQQKSEVSGGRVKIEREIKMIKDLKSQNPNIDKDTFVAETAVVIGDVFIGGGSSLWYGAVVRGDINHITIGASTNVQDNSTLHVDMDASLKIGNYTSIGHNSIVHGCTVGDNCLIGMGAIIMSGATVGDNCIIAAGTIVTGKTSIPPNSMVMGIPGKVIRQLGQDEIQAIRNTADRYEKLWRSKY